MSAHTTAVLSALATALLAVAAASQPNRSRRSARPKGQLDIIAAFAALAITLSPYLTICQDRVI